MESEDTTYGKMENHIKRMVSGEVVLVGELEAIGAKGIYVPKLGRGSGKEEAVKDAANFLLNGYSFSQTRNKEKYDILHNNGDGTFTRK